jgi:hypothetical protein
MKVLLQKRMFYYSLKKILKPILLHLYPQDHGKIINFLYFFHLILKNVFPVIISFIILVCVISKISFFIILAGYIVVLGVGNYWLISEEIDAQDVEFLLLRILPYQLAKDRRKFYFTLIFQHTFSSYIIYILNWILVFAISKNLLYALLDILFAIFDFFLQFGLLLKIISLNAIIYKKFSLFFKN